MANGHKKKRKKIIIFIVLAVILVVGAFAIFGISANNILYSEETVTERDISTYYSFNGIVSCKDKQTITTDSVVEVKQCNVKVGDKVEKGQTLFTINDSQAISSNVSGEVISLNAENGKVYMAGTELATIANMDTLQVDIKIDEYDINSVELDKEVDIYINSISKNFNGRVTNISKQAKTEQNVTYFDATVSIASDDKLRLGMSAEVKLLNENVKSVPAISMDSLNFDKDNSPYVYVKSNGDTIEQRYITLGINDGSYAEVKEGLNIGDVIAVYDKKADNDISLNGNKS